MTPTNPTPRELTDEQLTELEQMAEENASQSLASMSISERRHHAQVYGIALSEAAPALLAEIRRRRALDRAAGPQEDTERTTTQARIDAAIDAIDDLVSGWQGNLDETLDNVRLILWGLMKETPR